MKMPFDFSTSNAVLAVIDMQDLFQDHPKWGSPGLAAIVPEVIRLARHKPEDTLFTRFIPAQEIERASGDWQRFYKRWPGVTLAAGADKYTNLVMPLRALATAGRVFDKTGYSAFDCKEFKVAVQERKADALILCGVETDVCVWATALQAIDYGLHVILARDAVSSPLKAAHEAILDVLAPRLDAQVTILTVQEILERWR